MKESVVGKHEEYHLFGMTGLLCIDDVPLGIFRSPLPTLLALRPLRDTHRFVTTLLILTPLDRLSSTTIRTDPNKGSSGIRNESVDRAIQDAVRGIERER